MDTLSGYLRPVRRLLLLADATVVLCALALAMVERPVVERWLPVKALPSMAAQLPEYALIAVLTLPLWLLLVMRLELHNLFERAWSLGQLVGALVKLHGLGFVLLATLIYAIQVEVNRSLIGLFLVNSFVLMLAYRLVLAHRRRVQHRRGLGRARLLLVGEPIGALQEFVAQARRADFPPRFIGYLAEQEGAENAGVPAEDLDLSRLGGIAELDDVLHAEAVDYVLFFPPYDRAARMERELLLCEAVGVPAQLAIDLDAPTQSVPRLSTLWQRPFVSFEVAPKPPDLLAIKHAIDVAIAGVALLVLWPLLLLIAALVAVSMGRPVLFVQERSGHRGRPFRMLKFRTMVADAEQRKAELEALNETEGAPFKMSDDPRVTPVGRLLRRTSLDELPQLLNVLSGAMSIVGPRPLPLAEQQQLRGWHRRRLSVRPGITGLWQVSGRSELGFERWMELDLEYVDRWSPWLDVKILLKTIPVVLSQRGAR
ncbi:MAG: exopolysaccharide biosynthesis polyprenyl glycosylphosphotransferase [Deltaproteobacteria bacterium]|nr:exopolysaccharide biosynthesis polyprenyl glycosylphosphotransferase [Deltaproteobacteria bacterium]